MYEADMAKLLASHGLFSLVGEVSEDLFPAIRQMFGGQGRPRNGVDGVKAAIAGRCGVRACASDNDNSIKHSWVELDPLDLMPHGFARYLSPVLIVAILVPCLVSPPPFHFSPRFTMSWL